MGSVTRRRRLSADIVFVGMQQVSQRFIPGGANNVPGVGSCSGADLCMLVGNNGATTYGFDSVTVYGTMEPTTFGGVLIYSTIFPDDGVGLCVARMGVAGDEQVQGLTALDFTYNGYANNPVPYVWNATNLWYEVTDLALAAYMKSNLDNHIGGSAVVGQEPIPAPTPALVNGDFSDGSTGWGGLIVTSGVASTGGNDGVGGQRVNGLEISVEHKIFFDCDNQGASPALKVYTDTQAGTLLLQVNTSGTGMNSYTGVFTPTTDTIMIELANTSQTSLWDNIKLVSNNLVVNGDFASDINGWSGTNANLAFLSNQMEVKSTTTTYTRGDQIINGSKINLQYRVEFDYTISSSEVPYCGFGDFGSTPDSDTGSHQVYTRIPESNNENLGVGINTGGTVGDIILLDNIEVRKII